MPDALSATTLPISRLRDQLRIRWLTHPEARLKKKTFKKELAFPYQIALNKQNMLSDM